MKKSVSCDEKHFFKSVSCCRFPFRCSDKNQDRLREVARNKAFLLANLMDNHIAIIENTGIQLLNIRLSKYYARVFSGMAVW